MTKGDKNFVISKVKGLVIVTQYNYRAKFVGSGTIKEGQ